MRDQKKTQCKIDVNCISWCIGRSTRRCTIFGTLNPCSFPACGGGICFCPCSSSNQAIWALARVSFLLQWVMKALLDLLLWIYLFWNLWTANEGLVGSSFNNSVNDQQVKSSLPVIHHCCALAPPLWSWFQSPELSAFWRLCGDGKRLGFFFSFFGFKS